MQRSSSILRRGTGALSRARGFSSRDSPTATRRTIVPTISRCVNTSRPREFSSSTCIFQQERAPDSENNEQSFDHEYNASEQSSLPSPPKGQLSIVFTDIVKSTAIWERSPQAMLEAMQTHDSIVRSLVRKHQGYEVKQNGDGFMIAFGTATSALQFCLAVQKRLLDQRWPEELLELPAGKEASDDDGQILFRGLRLRMSVHWGEPVCVWNQVIQRMDYLGPVVNRAARFIQVTEGGQIVVSEDFLLEVQKAKPEPTSLSNTSDNDEDETAVDLQKLNENTGQITIAGQKFQVRLLGKHQFKGLAEYQKLYFIIPQSLSGRLDFWPKHKYIPGSKGNVVDDNN